MSAFADTAPRYTSYPTAPHFHAGIKAEAVERWMGAVRGDEPLSLYVHIPFCDKLCWFCACHTRHTLRYKPVADYLETLLKEIALVSARLEGRGKVRAVHFGGGSPTMLKPRDMHRLADALRAALPFGEAVDFSVEIDPSDMDAGRLDALAGIGTTRASLGVQDFDPAVQKAINREQSFELTRGVVEGLRERGISAVNLDLVYGLPHQTVASLGETVARCLEIAPDRMALFGYAHVPWFKKHQTMIDEAVLPGPGERLEQSLAAAAQIAGAGYVPVGIDHFALPGDSLAAAQEEGRLRRNFQGYTEDGCETLIGFGPSSISRYREGHAQNFPTTGDYTRAVENGALPVARGLAVNAEDRVRGWVIERLMCEFGFSIPELLTREGGLGAMLLAEAQRLAGAGQGLVRTGDRFEIPPQARAHARSVAAGFDTYLARGTARHSAAV
jgi:oxygen-independent coproporphyrinogen-3 oxidase